MTELGTRRSARRWALAAVAAAAVALPWGARANPGGHAEVRVGFLHFDYEETDSFGTFLDGETGFVPAITGELELRGEQGFFRVLGRLAKGTVSYDGHAQGAPSVDGLPLQTDSDAAFQQIELQGGLLVGDARQVALFAGLGARRWARDILPTTIIDRNGAPAPIAGLSEVYKWWELQLGVRWTFLQRPDTTWDLDARLVRTASPEMSVDLAPFGGPSSVTLELEAKTGWRLGSTFRRDLRPGGPFLTVSGYLEAYAFGASAVDPVYLIMEPDSTTFNVGLEVGLGTRF